MIRKVLPLLSAVFVSTGICQAEELFVFHINGINTTQEDAIKNAQALETTVNVHSTAIANNGHFGLLYNSENRSDLCSLCGQIEDTLDQKHNENETLAIYTQNYIQTNGLNIKPGTQAFTNLENSLQSQYFSDPTIMGDNFTNILSQFHQSVSNPSPVSTQNLNNFITANSTSGNQKPNILLIPHSQGCLYANDLYDELTTSEGYNNTDVSIYAVADPADRNAGNNISSTSFNNPGYITSTNDPVINALRVYADIPPKQSVLPANTTIPFGHGLIDTYLASSTSSQIIAKNVVGIMHYWNAI